MVVLKLLVFTFKRIFRFWHLLNVADLKLTSSPGPTFGFDNKCSWDGSVIPRLSRDSGTGHGKSRSFQYVTFKNSRPAINFSHFLCCHHRRSSRWRCCCSGCCCRGSCGCETSCGSDSMYTRCFLYNTIDSFFNSIEFISI